MKRRSAINTISLLSGAALVDPLRLLHSTRNDKVWIWMRPKTDFTQSDWEGAFTQCKDHGVHRILLQVYDSHHCFFDHPTLPSHGPVLESVIQLARQFDIEIHAWMWTMICNNPDIVSNHKDWYAINGLGQSSCEKPAYVDYYKFMCPQHPEVRAFVQDIVSTLSSIDGLSGIHLDYVRQPDAILASALQPKYNLVQDRIYPEFDYCYCPRCTSGFKNKFGVVPAVEMASDVAQQWLQYRMDTVTDTVNNYLAPIAKARDKFISAAVFPNWQSVKQQWMKWDLDAFFPMLYQGFYDADFDWIYEQTSLLKLEQEFNRPIYSGLFMGHIPSENLKEVMAGCTHAGATGTSLFDFASMTNEHWQAL